MKDALYGDGAFDFRSQTLGDFSLTTTNVTAQRTFDLLAPGTYNIAETVPAGWRQTAATCDNGNPPSNIRLAAGQTVTCTFVNQSIIMAMAIPTLSEWGLLLLCALLALAARWGGPMRAGRR